MGWDWTNPIGVVSAVAALFAFVMAALVYFTRPSVAANRRLALLLVAEGVWVLGGSGIIYLTDRAAFAYASQALDETALLALPALTMAFLATLETPLARPFRRVPVQVALLVATVAAEAWWFANPRRFIAGVEADPGYAAWEARFGPDHLVAILVLGAVSLFGLAAAIDAYVRTLPGTPARRRQGALLLAFGALGLGLAFFTLFVRFLTPLGGGAVLDAEYYLMGTALTVLAHVPLLAYGILRTQLFEIDLQLKRVFRWAAIPGAVAFVFALAGFVLHELAGVGVAQSALVAAAVASPVLLFAVPLSRVAAKLSAFALPGVADTPDYQAARRLELYRSALEDAFAKGAVTDRDATFLEDMRERLGIAPDEHRVLALVAQTTPRAPERRVAPKEERFRVVRELGQGGSGRALLAHDGVLDRDVVLKQPLAPWLLDREGREEFMREARILAKVQHPNVVALHEVVTENELPVLVLEYVRGGSLEALLRRRRMTPEEATRLAVDVLAGLARIHRDGIVHRDVKPANILLGEDGTAKLTDFGIAFPPRDPTDAAAGTRRATARQPGSLAYMSPEQASSRTPDERTDVYSLGVVLYEALTGRHYLDLAGRTEFEVRKLIIEAPPRLPDARVPGPLDRVIGRALAKDPRDRFASAERMAAALASGTPLRVPSRRRMAGQR